MLDTDRMRDPSIIERLTLAHHGEPSFGFAPSTSDNHAAAVAASEGPS
jgi:hypothetical protein